MKICLPQCKNSSEIVIKTYPFDIESKNFKLLYLRLSNLVDMKNNQNIYGI